MRITVSVRPNSRNEGIEERPDGSLLVRVRAPAKEGRANRAVIEAVAARFGCPKSHVRLVSGQKGKLKVLELPGPGD